MQNIKELLGINQESVSSTGLKTINLTFKVGLEQKILQHGEELLDRKDTHVWVIEEHESESPKAVQAALDSLPEETQKQIEKLLKLASSKSRFFCCLKDIPNSCFGYYRPNAHWQLVTLES